ncbi:MAG: sugar ABC transporter substrate-binding protein [Clostridiales Family XIII bacterium]|jgi:ABC-type sugar transport system substrate-binding protein|nr:sugar ABC transporter substrate-binding protein [Clostridiales Family XIII bacterium]
MKSKKILMIALCAVMAISFSLMATACSQPAEEPAEESTSASSAETSAPAEETSSAEAPAEVEKKTIGFYADAADSYYQLMNDALTALAQQDPETDWSIEYKVGQSTADEQLKAVEDFITAGYDAIIVIQNNPNTTSECIEKCKTANIPYFGAAHYFGGVANAGDSAGSTNFDFKACGVAAGENALAKGVKNVVMIEGVLGQGSASDQSLGFLEAYETAGKSLGEKADGSKWTAEEVATEKPDAKDVKGSPDVVIVQWSSGNWMAEPAQKEMANAISSLGKDGWDGAYVQNNPMVEGAIAAMKDAGLTTDDYWLGSCNGREISWQWAKDGVLSMDVNQPPTMEGAILYQQLKAFFKGEEYRKHLHPYITTYTKEDINELENTLVPITDVNNFIAKINDNSIAWEITDTAKFTDAEGNW